MPDFSQNRWDTIVESFFTRYSGLRDWHRRLVKTVNETGQYQGPTGRVWKFQLYPNKRTGAMEYRLPQIKNYPVQGTATADFAPLAMCEIWRRMRVETPGSFVVNLVHDEIICDCPENEWKKVANLIVTVYNELPRLIEAFFPGIVECNIPLGGDAKFGHSWGEMTPFDDR